MDKQIDLAVNFSKAPLEVQAAAKALYDAQKKVDSILKAIETKKAELVVAELAANEAQLAFNKTMKAWSGS